VFFLWAKWVIRQGFREARKQAEKKRIPTEDAPQYAKDFFKSMKE
jgi:hypothetical protein